jgi:uncharacterized protein YjbI with pentapeptide repeats
MIDYKAVPSGLDISRRVVDCLEADAPAAYQNSERARAIQTINDVLQGRTARTVDELLAELDKCTGKRADNLRSDIRDFQRQKELLTQTYNTRWNGKPYFFEQRKGMECRTLKVVDQKLYDRVAQEGFPPEFFREAYFDGVTFYCLPDAVDFYGSELHSCKFAVCRVKGISFCYTHIFDTEFYSCVLNAVDFYEAVVANTHFRNCELSRVGYQVAAMRHCNTIDCTMDDVDYAGTTLDGCSFGRVTARNIQLDYAIITQSGATEEECRQNKDAIYRALGVTEAAA